MEIAFASNQEILAAPGTTSEIVTDPLPLEGLDRATAMATVHYLFGQGGPSFSYVSQVSNDGTSWVDQGPSQTVTAAGVAAAVTAEVHAGFVRFVFRLAAAPGTGSCVEGASGQASPAGGVPSAGSRRPTAWRTRSGSGRSSS